MRSFVLLITIALAVSAQILNGGFEDNSCTSDLWCTYGPGSFCTGWECDAGTIDIHHNNVAQLFCYEGDFCVDVSGNEAGGIEQTFSTVIGHQYTISWFQSGNLNCAPVEKAMLVRVQFTNGANDGFGSSTAPPTPTRRYTFDTTGISSTNMQWIQEDFTFVATRSISTVIFTSDTNTACGVVIDNVELTDDSFSSPDALCNHVDQADWTPYGQGYYCYNDGFVQCWSGGVAFQSCAAGTSCNCATGVECSNHGTVSACV